MGNYNSAKQGYEKVLEVFKKHFGEDHVEYAITLANLSGVLYSQKDYFSAKNGYEKVL